MSAANQYQEYLDRTAGHEPVAGYACRKCGGLLRHVYVERTGKDAYLHDFERLTLVCEACGEEVEP